MLGIPSNVEISSFQLMEWKDIGVANLPGVISLAAGLLMWITSLHPVRKNYFELFFYTHQLYVIFVVFLALHVGDFVFSIAAGAIFLFVLDRFLRFCQYENLILVAGGIGISPFFAIISDICRRITEGKPWLPKNVLIIWAVKKSKELSLLSVLNDQAISSSCFNTLQLDIVAYVTQESEAPLVDAHFRHVCSLNLLGIPLSSTSRLQEEGIIIDADENSKCSSLFTTAGSSMSCLVGTGNNIWSGIYFAVSTFGFVLLYGLVEAYYIVPRAISAWWYRGLLFTICMVASVVFLGGAVVFFWHLWEKHSNSARSTEDDEKEPTLRNETTTADFASMLTTQYGRRPDFHDLFGSFPKKKGSVDVGVIVCGPPGLQTSVAKECRSQNIRGRWNQPVFHFNSHSFDL
ncbi:hypothetical protein GW17_00013027 [Ensete ventricosum]|uniref:Uncharacterized protein n=1 Tax=Ensete ventricosum TaxID=4639 RepID=A0A444FJF1_ENSVE|nr:hypothetical protein GW17_00013027 [Ensete ventricosum]RZR72861.1 hypothetical protein BHM03_00017999 [Ensete ventricosum]